jgi:hypothetical protein
MKTTEPYTSQWFYQPGMGWMWTNSQVFPYMFHSPEHDGQGGWLYFSQLPDQENPSFYDYSTATMVMPATTE